MCLDNNTDLIPGHFNGSPMASLPASSPGRRNVTSCTSLSVFQALGTQGAGVSHQPGVEERQHNFFPPLKVMGSTFAIKTIQTCFCIFVLLTSFWFLQNKQLPTNWATPITVPSLFTNIAQRCLNPSSDRWPSAWCLLSMCVVILCFSFWKEKKRLKRINPVCILQLRNDPVNDCAFCFPKPTSAHTDRARPHRHAQTNKARLINVSVSRHWCKKRE